MLPSERIEYLTTYLPIYRSTCLPIYLSTYLPFYLYTYLPIYLSIYQPTYRSTYLPIYLFSYLSIYLSICLILEDFGVPEGRRDWWKCIYRGPKGHSISSFIDWERCRMIFGVPRRPWGLIKMHTSRPGGSFGIEFYRLRALWKDFLASEGGRKRYPKRKIYQHATERSSPQNGRLFLEPKEAQRSPKSLPKWGKNWIKIDQKIY